MLGIGVKCLSVSNPAHPRQTESLGRLPLSHLPNPNEDRDKAEKAHVVVTDQLPVVASQIAKAAERDSVLGTVLKAVQHGGWPAKWHTSILPCFNRRNDLSVVDGCLLWGSRVVILKVFHTPLLEELHTNHLGMSHMKSLARSYIWWPQLNSPVEDIARNCTQCALVAATPSLAPAHPWLVPKGPLERVHVDHAQWNKTLLLVAVDAFSKWLEVFVVTSTSAAQTADKLRVMFATHALPLMLVSDNGPPFSSTEFHHFVSRNGINHRRVPPYHPSSNGLMENIVKTVKQILNKASKGDSIETKILKILASYRNIPHSVTGCTPAEILLGRAPRTQLSLVHPCMAQRMSIAAEERVGSQSPRTFADGQAVYVRDLRPSASSKRASANIVQKLGPLAYEVSINGYLRQAHVDHLKPWPETQPVKPDSDTPPSDEVGTDQYSACTPLVIVEESSDIDEQPDAAMNSTPEPVVCPQCNRQPPCRLIEELP